MRVTGTLNGGNMQPAAHEKPYAVEFYYKLKWGCQEKFLRLFRKNHLPLLMKQVENGPHAFR